MNIEQLDRMVFELRMSGKKDSLNGRLNIITYHWADVVKDLVYSQRYPNDKKIHLKNAELSIGDTLILIMMLCQDNGIDFSHALEMGFKHNCEKFEEVNDKDSVPI